MEFDFIAKFEGGDADQHRIPADEGSQSIQALSHSLVIVSHFLVTGEVRRKAPYDKSIEYYLRPPRSGSLDAIIEVVILGATILYSVGQDAAITVTKDILKDVVKTIFSRTIGKVLPPSTKEIRAREELSPGTFDALSDAIEPSILRAHTIINNGVMNISLQQEHQEISRFDQQSKEYIASTRMSDADETIDASVGSLNVNTGYGRIYLHELGKTVPFTIAKECDAGTYAALAFSIERYANRRPSDIQIRFRRITSPDGRTKKLYLLGARKIEEEL